jgi:hypothetical protein
VLLLMMMLLLLLPSSGRFSFDVDSGLRRDTIFIVLQEGTKRDFTFIFKKCKIDILNFEIAIGIYDVKLGTWLALWIWPGALVGGHVVSNTEMDLVWPESNCHFTSDYIRQTTWKLVSTLV